MLPAAKKGAKGIGSLRLIRPTEIKMSTPTRPMKEAKNNVKNHPVSPIAADIKPESFTSPMPIFPPEMRRTNQIETNPIAAEETNHIAELS